MQTVLVIGGGITGLTAMYELQKWKKQQQADVRLVLAEANDTLGGKIKTVEDAGFVMEAGADSMVTRKATVLPIDELGLEDQVVYNASGTSFLYTDGGLKQIPADAVFGIPTSIESLAKTPLVSAEGKVEALKDFYTPNESFTKKDSIGAFLEHFLGKEFVKKQIAPVLSGVYSGKLSDLTIATTLPYILDYKEKYGSIIKGFEANKEKFQSGGDKKFMSFHGGLKTLIDAYESAFDQVEIRKGYEANKIAKVENGYHVTFSNGEVVETDQVILSIPDAAAIKLFEDPDLAETFGLFKSSSLISVYLGFDVPDKILPGEGTGFITADSDDIVCNACTWTSKKWTHTSIKGNLLVRLFYKSSLANFHDITQMSEEQLLQMARDDINKAMGITVEPTSSEVTSWINNMPRYQMTHPQAVESLENALERRYPGVWVSGSSYYGVGIPDCVENGKQTAAKVIGKLV
ncbi:protoporphyrinogen oxidase [Aquibacillus koreensis]|uniref:Coproporphyrinogen III oxidase n=1 Tax=Aquibacillus koreensis TaxID=279446 RepID=A0A9X3WPT5_9BACI|nr:protoporphyrinogen oxidase [Aquibacillus koreensis]MCT2537885.1 protoporphyrinogen oxidase [Aquibacillus koreensis]MDC3422653.1 protoporphyrinogen oxidase [Aquibacillus koreensis]